MEKELISHVTAPLKQVIKFVYIFFVSLRFFLEKESLWKIPNKQ